MTTVEQLNPGILEEYQEKMVGARTLAEYDVYSKLEEQGHPYRMGDEEVRISAALEDAIDTYLSINDQIRNGQLLQSYEFNGDEQERNRFTASYALYAAARKAVDSLGSVTQASTFNPPVDKILDGATGREVKALQNAVPKIYADILEKVSVEDDGKMAEFTTDYLNSVADRCLDSMEEFPQYLEAVENTSLQLNGFILEGLQATRGRTETLNYGDTEWGDIVGNEKVKDTLQKTIDMLMAYDVEEGKNEIADIVPFPRSALIFGDPGTGKTLALQAAAKHAAEKAEELGKDLIIDQLDTDVSSKYKGETGSNIKEKMRRIMSPDSIGILYMEDVESLFPSRDELDGEPEHKEAFREVINGLQGVETDNRGNYLIVGTTNYPSLLDSAFEERFNVHIEAEGPETPEDYEEIVRIHLEEYLDDELIDVEDFGEIGELAHEEELSGREIDNITTTISSKRSHDIEFDEAFYDLSPEEKKDVLLSSVTPVTEDEMLDEIEEYVEEQESKEQRKREAEIERRLEKRELTQEVEERLDEEDGGE